MQNGHSEFSVPNNLEWDPGSVWEAKEWFFRGWRRQAVALAFAELQMRGIGGIHHAEDCVSEWLVGRAGREGDVAGGRFDRALKGFDPERGSLASFLLSDLRLYTVGTFARRVRNQIPQPEKADSGGQGFEQRPDRSFALLDIVQLVLQRLGPMEGKLLVMNNEGYSVREIARHFSVSEACVKTATHRARIKAREILGSIGALSPWSQQNDPGNNLKIDVTDLV